MECVMLYSSGNKITTTKYQINICRYIIPPEIRSAQSRFTKWAQEDYTI